MRGGPTNARLRRNPSCSASSSTSATTSSFSRLRKRGAVQMASLCWAHARCLVWAAQAHGTPSVRLATRTCTRCTCCRQPAGPAETAARAAAPSPGSAPACRRGRGPARGNPTRPSPRVPGRHPNPRRGAASCLSRRPRRHPPALPHGPHWPRSHRARSAAGDPSATPWSPTRSTTGRGELHAPASVTCHNCCIPHSYLAGRHYWHWQSSSVQHT